MSEVKKMHKLLLDAYIENDSKEKVDLQQNFESMVDTEITNAKVGGMATGFIVSITVTFAILSLLEII